MKHKDIEKIIEKTCARFETRLDLTYEEREHLEFLKFREKMLMKEIEVLKWNLKKVCGITGMHIKCIECDSFVVSKNCEEINQELLACKNNHVPF